MGCDIHLYKEKKEGDVWVTADTGWAIDDDNPDVPDIPWSHNRINRNYDLFGLLADHVRAHFSYSFRVRGLPDDVCSLVAAQSAQWEGDGHSHSHLTLTELRQVAVTLLLMDDPDIAEWQLQGISRIISLFPDNADGDTHRIVFWFDN